MGQFWEGLFRSNYYTNGQYSRQDVDRVAGVFDRPDCIYLLSSAEVKRSASRSNGRADRKVGRVAEMHKRTFRLEFLVFLLRC